MIIRPLFETKNLKDINITGNSPMITTHDVVTVKIDNQDYFLKFSMQDIFDADTPSLQILVEYLAYKVYQLYNVKVPDVELVVDEQNKRLGILTTKAQGTVYSPRDLQKFAKMMSAGIYVDILLCNRDVIQHGNVLFSDDTATRIDPGGSLTFRAQGARKGNNFGDKPGELKTMLSPEYPAGRIFSQGNLLEAAKTFTSVSSQELSNVLRTTDDEIAQILVDNKLTKLKQLWTQDFDEIHQKLLKRHKEILHHIQFLAKTS